MFDSLIILDMKNEFIGEVVISNRPQTLSARVVRLHDLAYNRYSVFFNQPVVDIGPSHILISNRVVNREVRWVCEEKSLLQDEVLAQRVGEEIDRMLRY